MSSIKSYGIIVSKCTENGKEFLLIRRKDTVSYVVFLRGLYSRNMLPILAKRMTKAEREKIRNNSFEVLWEQLWHHHPSKKYHHRQKFKKQFSRAKEKFEQYEWQTVFDIIDTSYTEPEWGFPKGRKKKNETPLQGAVREFCEETGYTTNDIKVIQNQKPLVEHYTGTDSKDYEILYFLAEMRNVDAQLPEIDEAFRLSEIGEIGWYSKQNALRIVRDYHKEKRELIRNL